MCNINCLSKQMKCVLRKWSFLIPAPSHRYTLSTTVKSQWRAASWDYGMQDVCLYKGNERCLNKAIQNYTEQTWSSLLCHSFVAWDETALRAICRESGKERHQKWSTQQNCKSHLFETGAVSVFFFFPSITGSGRLRSKVSWQRRDIGGRGQKSFSLTVILKDRDERGSMLLTSGWIFSFSKV